MEIEHRWKVMNKDVLAASVETAFWGKTVDKEMLHKVHDRWKIVLELIVKGRGSNNLVESHRGLKAKLDNLPEEPTSDDELVVDDMLRKIKVEK